ncbi:MAG: ABC transporter ATP-binding protein [Kiritimatiellae bacterium]|nr:ABC transporter ATP-binding protein [Kiritimatiellia bacterium]
MSQLLRVENLGKTYPTPSGPVPVLRDVFLSLSAGDFGVITGPSGSGKTTLLNLVGLLDVPTSGRVILQDEAVDFSDEARLADHRRRTLSMVFQSPCILPRRSVLENICFRLRYDDRPVEQVEQRAGRLLEQFGMTPLQNREARLLSGGEQQRLAVARALMSDPALLLADEPTGNLDTAAGRLVMDALAAAAHTGIAVLLVTHNPDWLVHATHHWICDNGHLYERDMRLNPS